ncbi:Nucleoside-diphosphate-sugar epimerase [Planctomycetales bacterium 10988]|nr:Nucleoside-diphosphate-sugar epimerase [Planctomycetales bacterium 10988]
MKVLVIGGTGRIGTYLIPQLVRAGHEVVCMHRGRHAPRRDRALWKQVRLIAIDRRAAERANTFALAVAGVEAEIVVDLLCDRVRSAERLATTLRGEVHQYLVCGHTAVYGSCHQPPVAENSPRSPLCDEAEHKLQMEEYLMDEARMRGLPVTVIHPGHLVAEGWVPLTPQGTFQTSVFERLAQGGEVFLPDQGLSTLHPVHASDVAEAFLLAIQHWKVASGEVFNIAAPSAITWRYYAETIAGWFDKQAQLRYCPQEEWLEQLPSEEAALSRSLLERSPCYSIAKAERLLGFRPRYDALGAFYESIRWLIGNDRIKAPSIQ